MHGAWQLVLDGGLVIVVALRRSFYLFVDPLFDACGMAQLDGGLHYAGDGGGIAIDDLLCAKATACPLLVMT